MDVLLTGFEPFRQWTVNSSGEVARALSGRAGLATRILPVDHRAGAEALRMALAETDPRLVLCTGLCPELRPRLELRARRPETEPDGTAVHVGVWPWAASLQAMRATGAPARLSGDAGAYVCETVYWTALDARRSGRAVPVAFLHLPPLSDAWPLDRHVATVEACLAGAAA